MIRVLITTIFLTSIAFSAVVGEEISFDCPDGDVAIQPPPAPIFTDSDMDPYGTTFSSPTMYSALFDDEGSSVWPDQDWNNDALIYGGKVGSGQDFDVEEGTNDIYAIFDTDHATQDSIVVYRSQDGGATWTFWRASYSSTAEMNSPHIRVVNDTAGQSWVCMFYLTGTTLKMRYMTPDQSSSGWTTVTASDVVYYDVDGEVGNNAWVYATYVVDTTDDIRVTRLSLDNKAWVDDANVFVDPQMDPYPSIAAGAGGTVSIAFLDDRVTTNQQIRIKRSTNYGSSWLGSAQVGDNSGGYGLSWSSIAYTHGSTENGCIFTTYDLGTDDNLGYYYTTDGGTSWAYGTTLGGTGDQKQPDVRARKSTGSFTLAFSDDPGDSTMFAWASGSSPNDFSTPVRINDFNATGNWPPTAGWGGSGGSNSAVLYTNWNNNYRLYFDWFGNVSTEEETCVSLTSVAQITSSPNPFTDMATINFSVTGTDPVSISIYNISGRLVKTVVDSEFFSNGDHSVQWSGVDSNGTTVVPGVYFCRMNTGDSILSSRMVRVR